MAKTTKTATADQGLQDDIVAIVLERCVHYRTRLDARERIPEGTRAELDLTLRVRGRLTKSAGSEVAPQVRVLCRRTLAELARQLKIEPDRLQAALIAAGKKATKRRQWLGDEDLDLSDPHVEAIATAEAAIVEKLAKVPRQGSIRVDATVDCHKRSTVIVRQ